MLSRVERLQKAFEDYKKDPVDYAKVSLIDDDISKWKVYLFGPKDTPYENGIFDINFTFPERFPKFPPFVQSLTKIFHMNVNRGGLFCIDITQKDWKKENTKIKEVLDGIYDILKKPIPENALNDYALQQYYEDIDIYNSIAKEYTLGFAGKDRIIDVNFDDNNDDNKENEIINENKNEDNINNDNLKNEELKTDKNNEKDNDDNKSGIMFVSITKHRLILILHLL